LNESSIQSGKDSGEDSGPQGNASRHRAWRRALISALAWIAVVVYFAAAALFLGLRYWLLPDVAKYAGVVEQALSRTIGERVTIGGIRAGWHGLRPVKPRPKPDSHRYNTSFHRTSATSRAVR